MPTIENKPLKRTHFFFGRLLSAEDLRGEQDYFLEKQRRHNRLLHGWGVVSGLEVELETSKEGDSVRVSPGYALDPWGNEILVPEPVELPLPEGRGCLCLVLKFCEEWVDLIPASGESQEMEAASIQEGYQLEFIREEESLVGEAADEAQAEDEDQLVLARLRFSRIRWRLDLKFIPKTVRV